MALRVRTIQTSFSAGELDPELAGRSDVERYFRGAERARNVLVRPTGGLRRRPGLRHVATIADGNAGCRLVDFNFNAEQTYLLVFTANTIRVFKDDMLVHTITGAPWNAQQVQTITWTQSADTLIVFHPDVPPQRLLRQGSDTNWSLTALPLTNIPGHDYGAVTPTGTITPSATTGDAITLTASASIFTAGMVGWYLRTTSNALARITAFTSATQVTARVLRDFPNTNAIPAADWSLREPVISATRGWPSCGVFYAGRLYMGGLKSRPATVLGSRVGDFFNFDPGRALDDDSIDVTIDTDQVNAIRFLAATRQLHAFTSGGEHVLAGDSDGVITPASARWIEQTRRGAVANVPVVEVDGALLFVQRGGKAVRQHLYDEVQGAYGNIVLSRLSEHLIRQPVDMAVRKGATRDAADHVLVVNNDGTVAVLLTERSQETVAWTLWETDGVVRQVAALDDGAVYFGVTRDGAYRVERWDDDLLVDAGVRVTTGMPLTTVTGLAHLNGLTVAIVADGSVQPSATVTGGTVTLPRPAEQEVQVGLPFTVLVRPMPPEPRLPGDPMLGRKARIVRASMRVNASGPFTCNGIVVDARRFGAAPNTPLTAPPRRLTGDARLSGLTGWQFRPTVDIAQSDPQPFQLLALSLDIAT
jgi:hypothetical protein